MARSMALAPTWRLRAKCARCGEVQQHLPTWLQLVHAVVVLDALFRCKQAANSPHANSLAAALKPYPSGRLTCWRDLIKGVWQHQLPPAQRLPMVAFILVSSSRAPNFVSIPRLLCSL